MSVALGLHDLQCLRGTRLLFSGLSASVRGGEMLRVQGENGSGKTSLLRIICGLSGPDHGEVLWGGQDISRQREAFNLQLVYMGHAPALKDDLSAKENLRANCSLAGIECSEAQASSALAQAGLSGRDGLPVRALSQGQRKRAGLARLALSGGLPLWVLDEPFSALDNAACGWLKSLISGHLQRDGVVVLTNHQSSTWDEAQPQVAITCKPPAAPRAAVQ